MRLDYLNYMLIVLFGVVITGAVFMKLVIGFDIDSDWFWFIAGLGIAVEGSISFEKQRMFDRKYKVVRRV